jgi:hypothetical protein
MHPKDMDKIEIQLGERPESPDHLRRIEKRLKVHRNFGNVTPISQMAADKQERMKEREEASDKNYRYKDNPV